MFPARLIVYVWGASFWRGYKLYLFPLQIADNATCLWCEPKCRPSQNHPPRPHRQDGGPVPPMNSTCCSLVRNFISNFCSHMRAKRTKPGTKEVLPVVAPSSPVSGSRNPAGTTSIGSNVSTNTSITQPQGFYRCGRRRPSSSAS